MNYNRKQLINKQFTLKKVLKDSILATRAILQCPNRNLETVGKGKLGRGRIEN